MKLDIWIKDCGGYYKHIAVYVDDLLIASKDSESIVKCFLEDYKFKLKGTGPIKCYLGCDFFKDSDSVLYFAPKNLALRFIHYWRKEIIRNLTPQSS